MKFLRPTLLRFLLLGAAAAPLLSAHVSVSPYFADGMILQRDRPISVWGSAEPGEKIRVEFHGHSAETTAAADGKWKATLDPLPAADQPAELVIAGSDRIKVSDVLLGDVWLCSGQSNMQFIVYGGPKATFQVDNALAEIAQANHPLIRQFKFPDTEADEPNEKVAGKWTVCSPETVKDFTAAGYFFARDLQQKIHVPIGLVLSSWGNTPIEAWISAPMLASDPAFAVVGQRWQQALRDYPEANAKYEKALAAWTAAKEAAPPAAEDYSVTHLRPKAPWHQGEPATPSGLFNGMIHPLLSVAFRGVLWYQGENNTVRWDEYRRLMTALVVDWRQSFGQPDLPFFWVQLAAYGAGKPTNETWPRLREAQTQVLSLPNTGMAVAIDIGDRTHIHPHHKQEVGRRLALLAENKVYGLPVVCEGPMFLNSTRRDHGLVVAFSHADSGLVARGGKVEGFVVAGADRKFHPAEATIEGESVFVHSAQVDQPIAVRYAWVNFPPATLYNRDALPAVPFRSDDWPIPGAVLPSP